jgi:uncharacterized protein
MKINCVIWLQTIIDKLNFKHKVSVYEVEEILCSDKTKFRFVEKGHIKRENVYAAIGQCLSGRYLIVFFIYKNNKDALILSARTADNKERGLL